MKWTNPGHEYDDIGNKLKDVKNVFLWGIGYYAEEILTLFNALKDNIQWKIYLIDSNRFKQTKEYMGYRIISPEVFYALEKRDYFVIDCPEGKAGDEIKQALIRNNISEDMIFRGSYFLFEYLPIYFAYVKDKVFFTSENMLCSTACNLNCRDCLNFTPYIKETITDDFDSLRNDVDLFFGAVDLIYRFQLTGGEPLLYKDLGKIIKYIYQNYKEKIIRLEMVTNGTIVPSDEICEIIKECNVYVFLDDYRLSVPDSNEVYDEVRNKFERYEINYCDNYVEKWIRMYPAKNMLGDCEKYKLENLFSECHNPWSTLRKGKISSCNYAGYAAKAGICDDEENEYFDLSKYSTDQKKQLVEFRTGYSKKGYTEFCKKCGGWTSINHNLSWSAIQEPKV